jgi:hypothetical protein
VHTHTHTHTHTQSLLLGTVLYARQWISMTNHLI